MELKFASEEHKAFYDACMSRPEVEQEDYFRALFYTLGISPDTRKHLDDLFDFSTPNITPMGMHSDWVDDDSRKVIRMAYNLWDGYGEDIQDEEGPGYYTPEYLFNSEYAPYFVEAIKLRYPSPFRDLALDIPAPAPPATVEPQASPAPEKPKLAFSDVLGNLQDNEYNKMWYDYAEVGGADALDVSPEQFIQYVLEEFQQVRKKFGEDVLAFVYKGVYQEVMVPKEIHNSAVFIANGGSRKRYGDMLRKGIFLNDFGDDYYKALARQFPQPVQTGRKGRKPKPHRGGAR